MTKRRARSLIAMLAVLVLIFGVSVPAYADDHHEHDNDHRTHTHTLTIKISPVGGGTVTKDPVGPYSHDQVVTLSATPNPGFTFDHWNHATTTNGDSATVKMTSNKTVDAHFKATVQYTIEVEASPLAGGTVGGAGTFDTGDERTVTATASTYYEFVNWTEAAIEVSADSSYTFFLTENRDLVANFEYVEPATVQYTIEVEASPLAGGTVGGAGTFDTGDERTVTATASTYYEFVNWTEAAIEVSADSSYTFFLTENRDLVANFEYVEPATVQYTIEVEASPLAGGTVGGAGTFDTGDERTVTATASTDYEFVNWTEAAIEVSADSSYTFFLTENRDLVANFELYDDGNGDDGQFETASGPTGTLTITVVKSDAGSVAGLTVTVTGGTSATLTTNGSGVVTIPGLAAGEYTANSGDTGYTTDGPKSATLVTDSSATITITLTPVATVLGPTLGTIEGIVVDGDAALLAGATVTVYVTVYQGTTVYATTTSDADGAFVVLNVLPGEYSAMGTLADYSDGFDGPVTVVAGETSTMTIVLGQAIEVPVEEPGAGELPNTGATYAPNMMLGLSMLLTGLGLRRRGRH